MVIIIILIITSCNLVSSHIFTTTFNTIESWNYIDYFSFRPTPLSLQLKFYNDVINNNNVKIENPSIFDEYSLVKYKIKLLTNFYDLSLYVYEDYYKFISLYNNDRISCSKKSYESGFSIALKVDQFVINHGDDYSRLIYNKYDSNTNTATGYITFSNIHDTNHNKKKSNDITDMPIYAFFAIANCNDSITSLSCTSNCNGPVMTDVSLTFTNAYLDDVKYLPYDEINILRLVVVMFIVQIFIILAAIKTRISLYKIQKLHPTYRLVVLSTVISAIGILCQVIYYGICGRSGQMFLLLTRICRVFIFLAYVVYFIHLIFIAKGFGINRKYISKNGILKILLYTTVFVISFVFGEIYYAWVTEFNVSVVRLTKLPSETTSTIGIIAAESIASAVWFLYASYTTSINFPTKKTFYIKYCCGFSLWLLSPLLLTLISFRVPLYQRLLFRSVWQLLIPAVSQIISIIMYNPQFKKINHGFPFHSITDMDNSFFPRQLKVSEKYIDDNDNDNDNNTKLVTVSTLDRVKSLNDKGLAVNISDIYCDIKELGLKLTSHIGGMQTTMRRFKILLEDWDLENDEGDEAYKYD